MADAKQVAGMEPVRAYLEYFRDMGVYDFYRNGEPSGLELVHPVADLIAPPVESAGTVAPVPISPVSSPVAEAERPRVPIAPVSTSASLVEMAKIDSLTDLIPAAQVRVAAADKAAALRAIQDEIGDCTRCPLAYAGRRKIVFADGDPNARLMFVGEGPGADEDEQGLPFVGKSGQLLNNMIVAMGLTREQVYIANVVKCRPPANRAPEPVEAKTCTPFLARQMDVVRPEVVVALGAKAAMYLLGVKQSLSSLRGKWHEVRGAKAVVTYHPAFLLRDPRQKGEAWKDLQMVMAEMGLKR
jgi:uracil-DNA glycosylase family 4